MEERVNKSGKRATTESEKNYYDVVRDTLCARVKQLKQEGYNFNWEQLATYMNKTYFIQDEKNDQDTATADRLRHLLTVKQAAISMPLVVALCDILRLDLYTTVGCDCFHRVPSSNLETRIKNVKSYADTELSINDLPFSLAKQKGLFSFDNSFLLGTYHVYYFRAKQIPIVYRNGKSSSTVTPLTHGVLNLAYKGGKTTATLEEIGSGLTQDGAKAMPSITLRGQVYRLENCNLIYMTLTDSETSSLHTLLLPYTVVRKDNLYFSMGGIVKASSEVPIHPLIERIVLFRDELDLEKYGMQIRGMLSLQDQSHLFTRKEYLPFEPLAAFLDPAEFNTVTKLLREEGDYYVLQADSLLSAGIESDKAISLLLQLQAISEQGQAVNSVRIPEEYPPYAKLLQRKQAPGDFVFNGSSDPIQDALQQAKNAGIEEANIIAALKALLPSDSTQETT